MTRVTDAAPQLPNGYLHTTNATRYALQLHAANEEPSPA